MTAHPFLLFPANERYLQRQTGTPHYGQANLNSGCLAIVIISFVVVSLFWVYMSLMRLYENNLIATNGMSAVATVTGRVESEDEGSYSYTLYYEYLVSDRRYTGSQSVLKRDYDLYQVGQDIPITYVMTQPHISRLRGTETVDSAPLLLFFTILWLFVMGGFSALFFLAWRRFGRLKRKGKLIYGELIAFKGEKDSDGDYQITVKAKFRSPANLQWIEGSRHYTCNHHLNTRPPDVSTPLAIFYADDKVWEVL